MADSFALDRGRWSAGIDRATRNGLCTASWSLPPRRIDEPTRIAVLFAGGCAPRGVRLKPSEMQDSRH